MSTRVLTTSEAPQIGRFYMVRCIRLKKGGHSAADREGWIPCIGPEHHDREVIGFASMHLHADVRFMSDATIARVAGPFYQDRAAQYVMGFPVSTHSDGKGGYSPLDFELSLRRKKCHRGMPDFPRTQALKWLPKLEAAHAGCKLKPGNICPHRGIDLTPFIKDDGTVVCPGHGLEWNTRTGELIRGVTA